MNPAEQLYQVWHALLALRNPYDITCDPSTFDRDDAYRNRYPYGKPYLLARDHGIAIRDYTNKGDPIIGFGRRYYYSHNFGRDFDLYPDGSFTIYHYDNDLKHLCRMSFLGWCYVAGQRVLMVDPVHRPYSDIDPADWCSPRMYYRWNKLACAHKAHYWLMPDDHGHWQFASEAATNPQHILDGEHAWVRKRYQRHRRREERTTRPRTPDSQLAASAERIALLLEPHKPAATTPLTEARKEAQHGHPMDARPLPHPPAMATH